MTCHGWYVVILSIGILCSLTLQVTQAKSTADTTSPVESCEDSRIQYNATLKGGIKSGIFRKLAQYVAMRLCVRMCCQEKGCDVAFMAGKNCYGVQCFSEEQCESVPAKAEAPSNLMISHVTIRGEGANTSVPDTTPVNLKCQPSKVESGVTIKGGLKAGNFTDVGPVENMKVCNRLCCVAEKCNLAMMIQNTCFLVSCFTSDLCKTVKTATAKYKPLISSVTRHTQAVGKETANTLASLPVAKSKLMCKNSVINYNHTLKAGYKSGNFTEMGKVKDMSACIRLCCGNKRCDVAFMLESNCYAVDCYNKELCQSVAARQTGALAHLNPRLSFITSRSEEVYPQSLDEAEGNYCKPGEILYDVTLKGGLQAGRFTPLSTTSNMASCISLCCKRKDCDAAFMLKNSCFSVQCHSEDVCEQVPAPYSKYNPRLSFVVKDPGQKNTVKKVSKSKAISSSTKNDNDKQLTEEINKMSAQMSAETKQLNKDSNSPATRPDSSSSKSTTNKPDNDKSKTDTTQSTTESAASPLEVKVPNVEDAHYCTNSEIMENITLRGGIKAGNYIDRGKMKNIKECLQVCCIATSCDLAFMLGDHCFSVTCFSEKLCEPINARLTKYKPKIVFIYARTKHMDKDAISKEEKLLSALYRRKRTLSKELSMKRKRRLAWSLYQRRRKLDESENVGKIEWREKG